LLLLLSRRSRKRKRKINTEKGERRTTTANETSFVFISSVSLIFWYIHSLFRARDQYVFASSGWNISPINAFAIVKGSDVGY
jgi:hypothetical protein